GAAAELCGERGGDDVHHERGVQDLRVAADEGGMGGSEWSRGAAERGAGAAGGDRRHVLIDECASAMGARGDAGDTARVPGATYAAGTWQSGGVGSSSGCGARSW